MAQIEATEPEVDIEDDAAETEGLANDPRAQAMADIVEARKEELATEDTGEPMDGEPTETVAAAEDDDPTVEVADETEHVGQQADGTPVFERDGKYYVKTKVFGKEEEVELNSVVQNHQKYAAGEHNLQRAAETLQKAQEYERLLQQREAELEAKRVAFTQNPAQNSNNGKLDDKHRLFAEAIYEGDLDEVARLSKELYAGRPDETTPAMTPQQIAGIVQQQIEEGNRRNHYEQAKQAAATAKTIFEQEYEDVYADEDKRTLWELKVVDKVKENRLMGNDIPVVDVMREVGDQIRSKFVPQQPKRLERGKSALPNVAGRSETPRPPEAEKPKTATDVIKQMMKARGQNV